MRYHIKIEKAHIASLLLMLAGIVLTVVGVGNSIRLERSVGLDELALAELRPGQYVTGSVTRVLSTPEKGVSSGKYCAVAITDALTSTVYYTVPIGDGSEYLTLIAPRQYDDFVEVSTDAPENNASLELRGKIVDGLRYGLNYGGLKSALNVETDGEVEALVSAKYGIRIVDFERERAWLWAGLSLFVTGTAIFLFNLKSLVSREKPETVAEA